MAGGRPTKLTKETQARILEVIEAGGHYVTAAGAAGVDYSTFRKWMVQGAQARRGQFFEFFQAVRQAEAKAEADAVTAWKAAIPDSWQAARDFLARRFPERWSERSKVEHSLFRKEAERYANEYGLDADELIAMAEELSQKREQP